MLKIDNTAVREAQIKRLKELRASRDSDAVAAALDALTKCARAATATFSTSPSRRPASRRRSARSASRRRRCSDASSPSRRRSPAIYARQVGDTDSGIEKVHSKVEVFQKREGRRPRILIAKLGPDGHNRGQQVVASGFADLGFDVDVGPPYFQTPEEAAQEAVDNDVHVVGASSLAAGHLTLIPALKKALAERGRGDILIVAGGVIPPQDYDELYADGVAAIFGPGTVISDSAEKILDLLADRAPTAA